MNEWKARFAVVRDDIDHTFRKWHETEKDAIEEAKRLAQKEQLTFIVIKEVGVAFTEEIPVHFKRPNE